LINTNFAKFKNTTNQSIVIKQLLIKYVSICDQIIKIVMQQQSQLKNVTNNTLNFASSST